MGYCVVVKVTEHVRHNEVKSRSICMRELLDSKSDIFFGNVDLFFMVCVE